MNFLTVCRICFQDLKLRHVVKTWHLEAIRQGWKFALSLFSLFTLKSDESDSLLLLFSKEQLEQNERIPLFTF